tara:strand:+ start:654 stop:764 length:111 start_codon:yes stop_codon:yes gene_type:complete
MGFLVSKITEDDHQKFKALKLKDALNRILLFDACKA